VLVSSGILRRKIFYVLIRARRVKVRKLWKIAHPYGPAINNSWRQEARDLCCMRLCVSPSALIFSRNLDRATFLLQRTRDVNPNARIATRNTIFLFHLPQTPAVTERMICTLPVSNEENTSYPHIPDIPSQDAIFEFLYFFYFK